MKELKYTKRAWFVNKFDIVICALTGPVLFAMIVFTMMGNAQISSQGITTGLLLSFLAMLVINVVMALVVTHKAWGWLLLPVFVIVRALATILASLCGLLGLAMLAYQSQSKQKISNAWTNDNRSRNYRNGMKDAATAEGFKSAGSGLWGFLVSHTLEFSEK